ncbi:hypothetical protein D3C83_323700 [compost metagenome]
MHDALQADPLLAQIDFALFRAQAARPLRGAVALARVAAYGKRAMGVDVTAREVESEDAG